MAAQGLKAEVMEACVGMSEEEYWYQINGLACNSLAGSQTLEELRVYYNTHDESVLGNQAENLILRNFGLLKY